MVDFCTNIWLNGKVVATFVYKLNIDIILEYCQLGEDVLWSTIMDMRVYIYMRFRL